VQCILVCIFFVLAAVFLRCTVLSKARRDTSKFALIRPPPVSRFSLNKQTNCKIRICSTGQVVWRLSRATSSRKLTATATDSGDGVVKTTRCFPEYERKEWTLFAILQKYPGMLYVTLFFNWNTCTFWNVYTDMSWMVLKPSVEIGCWEMPRLWVRIICDALQLLVYYF